MWVWVLLSLFQGDVDYEGMSRVSPNFASIFVSGYMYASYYLCRDCVNASSIL